MGRNIQSKTRAGFTLLEVMVSLTVGGIALGSIYAVGAASTRHFREQQRISAAQTSLRAAMATLKHDFQRAGFLSTPNSTWPAQACYVPPALQDGWVGAINGYRQNVAKPGSLDRDNLNSTARDIDGREFFSVDLVWLTGNYATSGEYPNIRVVDDGLKVEIPMGWQSFQRDFSEWSGANAGTCNEGVFANAFPPNRLVRLHAQNGTFAYGRVANVTCTGNAATGVATVTLREAIPNNCNMEGGWIAPVNTLHYHVEDADTNREEDDSLKRTTVLRRTEVKPDARAEALEVSGVRVEDRSLLDYVVRFKVDFLMADATDEGRVSTVPMTELEWSANPQLVRAAIIDVAVRTPQQESDFTQDVSTAAFKLYAGKGAARVRRAHAEVLMPNVANRNLLLP